ncbi:hypothetical protein GF1_30130 [Desulfolithobacter dissulfuricans]|uniref:Uncharacterized protein n=1 Tax=Desulfolithobacter dissulfuricans TaxID=2795293 RepID=A0A915XHP0_9BACT|nr:hypothetical protein [Desulfolithobacter dissulfuricans]BCO07688.1 hypothetical protein GF1_00640 [Desulfolithobacter dissulfuricans]BCO08275.1 hypothetical protein GF1_06510 [Desulfolithobacter dissulfuricans]BCO08879.1 hypothetical protein GF1_12550 [Desulfolithobacter dissulfuricans]BCO10637.1 hypothetical protein GF1_30130 [Desulfolithobacter dissulfuricans]
MTHPRPLAKSLSGARKESGLGEFQVETTEAICVVVTLLHGGHPVSFWRSL